MNNPNPFVPKGSLLEQQSQRRSRLKIAVFCVLAVSVTGLVLTLIEGCKREAPEPNPAPQIDTNTSPLETSNLPPVTDTNPPPPPMAMSNAVVPPPPPPAPMEPAAASTYSVVAGDTLDKIRKAQHVSLKALEAANPGVDPRKLKVGQKLNIPAPTPSADTGAATPAGAGVSAAGGAGGETYVVKSGDTLSKIATRHGITLKALRAANPSVASTDHIKVGDKLTIPPKADTSTSTSAPAAAADTTLPPMSPPTSTPAPPATGTAPGH